MFKSAATKIAHNSTLPSLAGNNDLKALQDLITAEKTILLSLQKLGADFQKAAETLRTWGLGEGEDLGDVLSASHALYTQLAGAFTKFSNYHNSVREHLKAVRTREEDLDDLKRRRKSVAAKAEAAEKKLNKMSPEHKSLQMQTELLNRLRDEIRGMDSDIMTKEARLGDFKRLSTKNFMTLKYCGLLEFGEKATIIGEMGKLIIEEIPLNVTLPGDLRLLYNGQTKVDSLVSEAQRCLAKVTFTGETVSELPPLPPSNFSNVVSPTPNPSEMAAPNPGIYIPGAVIEGLPPPPAGGYIGTGEPMDSSIGFGPPAPPKLPGPSDSDVNVNEFGVSMPIPSQPQPQPYISQSMGPLSTSSFRLSEEGLASNAPSPTTTKPSPITSRLGLSVVRGGRFASFPVRSSNRQGITLRDSPVPGTIPPEPAAPSVDASYAASPSAAYPSVQAPLPAVPFSTLSLPNNEASSPTSLSDSIANALGQNTLTTDTEKGDTASDTEESPVTYETIERVLLDPAARASPRPGDYHTGYGTGHTRGDSTASEDVQLPYMAPATVVPAPAPARMDRHVRFDMEPETPSTAGFDTNGRMGEARMSVSVSQPSSQMRIPSPPPSDDEMDEQALNAAAAREISRELDALNFNPPPVERRPPPPLAPPAPLFAGGRSASPKPPSSPIVGSPYVRERDREREPGTPTVVAARASSPAPLSPRIGSPPQIPPTLNLPQQPTILSPTPSTYGTPPEYPSMIGTPSLASASATSLPLTPSGGTRTISASAFKRPQFRSPGGSDGGSDTSPLSLKKRALPTSPYPLRVQPQAQAQPQPDSGGPTNGANTGSPRTATAESSPYYRNQPAAPPYSPLPPADDSGDADGDGDYQDLLSSYHNAEEPGNMSARDEMLPASGTMSNDGVVSPGYGQGRFATNLDEELR